MVRNGRSIKFTHLQLVLILGVSLQDLRMRSMPSGGACDTEINYFRDPVPFSGARGSCVDTERETLVRRSNQKTRCLANGVTGYALVSMTAPLVSEMLRLRKTSYYGFSLVQLFLVISKASSHTSALAISLGRMLTQ